jgi:hypothetical protein
MFGVSWNLGPPERLEKQIKKRNKDSRAKRYTNHTF